MRNKFKKAVLFLSILVLGAISPLSLRADVLFYDEVVVKGKTAMLKAKTGRGELVEFFVDNQSLGKSLSGGDGIAYIEFTPKRRGILKVTVKSTKDKAEGLVLSLTKGSAVIFVDVEGSLFDKYRIFFQKPRQGSQQAVRDILKMTPVVYLDTAVPNIKALREWLSRHGYPQIPLLQWSKELLDELTGMGIRVRAVIGGAGLIEETKDLRGVLLLSFEDIEGAEEVNDWKEIVDHLRKTQ